MVFWVYISIFPSNLAVTVLCPHFRAALGLVSYGLVFGVQALSGNIYFNFFLFNLVGIPSKAVALWLQNRFAVIFLNI